MNPLILQGLFQAGMSLIERFFPDPEKKAAAQMELLKLQQSGELAKLAAETDLAKGQLAVNVEEAKSASIFISGWRPAVGWTCAAGLAYVAVLEPLARFCAAMLGYDGAFPVIDTTITLQVLLGMLGLGGLRSLEKVKGAEGNR
jgi:hypothetical protein